MQRRYDTIVRSRAHDAFSHRILYHEDSLLPATTILYLCQTGKIAWSPDTTNLSLPPKQTSPLHITMDHPQPSPAVEDRAPSDMPGSFTRRQRLRAIAVGGENLYEPPNTAEAFALLEAAIDEVKFHDSTSDGRNLITRRQHLKAIIATCRDLYEPPNTAEAFARLEAAINEVKRHASASDNDSGQEQLLDPPNTAERFNRIESAIDEVLAASNDTTGSTLQAKRSKSDPLLSTKGAQADHKEGAHLLRKRQLRYADQSVLPDSNHTIGESRKESGSSISVLRPHALFSRHGSLRPRSETYRSSNDYNHSPGQVGIAGRSVLDLTVLAAEGTGPCHDLDIFRDDDSVQSFANQTFQHAKEKYL
jgi:hypothetical protein